MTTTKRELKDNLADIQGIVLTGYAFLNEATYLFLKVSDAIKARQWLNTIRGEISNAASYPTDAAGNKVRPTEQTNIAFSYAGLKALGFPEKLLGTFSTEFQEGPIGQQRSEMMGDTGDSAPECWEWGAGEDSQPHIMLMLFATSPEALAKHQSHHEKLIKDSGGLSIASKQNASRLEEFKEHFGYRDGISQPGIEGSPYASKREDARVKPGEFIFGYENEYGLIPPMPEPSALGMNGTYLVYRKLEQNVELFNNFLLEKAGGDQAQADAIGAKFMGRWKSGAPLAVSPDKDNPELGANTQHNNQFTYAKDDPYGYKTPIGSHIRRSNPRDGLEHDPEASELTINRHRILRRGRPYGPKYDPANPDTLTKERGTLFIALNTDIKRQFEFIQQVWVNDPKFAGMYNNEDPIVGRHNEDGNTMTIQRWPVRKEVTGMPRFVKVRVSGYFFLPGIKGLEYIAKGDYSGK